jgi:nucleoside-diphosphate-sugar epimerase
MNKDEMHVIFGTGPLGQAVMHELVRRGKCTQMVNRSGKRPAGVPQTVQVTAADAYDPKAVEQVTRGAAVVYQCAQPEYTEWPEKFPPLLKSIIAGVSGSEAKLVMGDNLYMYGAVDGPIHEGLPYNAKGPKGLVRARIADELMEAHHSGRLRVTIGRGSDFFGPAVLGSMVGETVFGALAKGKTANVMGNIDLPHTYTFIDDFGKALVVLGEHEEALGQAWHIPNAKPVTTRQFVQMAAEAFGVRPKMMTAGPLMMRVIGLFVPEIREMIELEYEVMKPYIVDDSKYKKAFGDHSKPLNEAIGQTAEWFKMQSPA